MDGPVLIVDDEPLQQQMLGTLLKRKLGYESRTASNGREALDLLAQDQARTIRLVILDLTMPVMGGMEALQILKQQYPALPVIMLTGSQDIADAVQAMKYGATDFLNKPYEGERMLVTVKNALKISTLTQEITRLKRAQDGTLNFANLIGHDGGLSPLIAVGRKAAASDIPVLITGETGVGKEVFARAIHGESARASQPFITVNCGAIPAQLVESILFGHEKGAFTGATEKTIGKFREAEGGTIFLDEVGELPPETQVKLLRVLQQREVEPVGASRPVPIDVRLISATNRNLQNDVEHGRFREDLYFRLNVLQITIPPLRERRRDIRPLVHHFIDRAAALDMKPVKDVDPEAWALLEAHAWPGNVRQMENAVRRALVLSDSQRLKRQDFENWLTPAPTPDGGRAPGAAAVDALALMDTHGAFKPLDQLEKEIIAAALAAHGENMTQAATALRIAKSTLYRKIANFNRPHDA